MQFRDLTADEIDVRVSTVSDKGCSLLLYKDARCDMNILDETVGAENWQRHHTRDNANCVVSIWCTDKNQWVEKEDTGTESYTEKEKGQASDSFKRACFNWGIGRELYTAPLIWVGSDKCNITPKNGKPTTYDKFIVSNIRIENKKITALEITNTKTNAVCFRWSKSNVSSRSGNQKQEKATEQAVDQLTDESKESLNSAIGAYVKISGIGINEVMAMLKKEIKKSPKAYTEEDAKRALAVIDGWQKKLMEQIGV